MFELMQQNPEQLAILGSYFLSLLLFYLSVALIFYFTNAASIKSMMMIKDPKAMARNRKQVLESIEVAEKNKKMMLLWPIVVFKGLRHHGKTISKKEK